MNMCLYNAMYCSIRKVICLYGVCLYLIGMGASTCIAQPAQATKNENLKKNDSAHLFYLNYQIDMYQDFQESMHRSIKALAKQLIVYGPLPHHWYIVSGLPSRYKQVRHYERSMMGLLQTDRTIHKIIGISIACSIK